MFWVMQRLLKFGKDSYNSLERKVGWYFGQKTRTDLHDKHMWFYLDNVSSLFQEFHNAFNEPNNFETFPCILGNKVARMFNFCKIVWGLLLQCFNFVLRTLQCIFMNNTPKILPLHFRQNVSRMSQLCKKGGDLSSQCFNFVSRMLKWFFMNDTCV